LTQLNELLKTDLIPPLGQRWLWHIQLSSR
jgi:hypothetical protein